MGNSRQEAFEEAREYYFGLIDENKSKGMRIAYNATDREAHYKGDFPFLRDGSANKILTQQNLHDKVLGRVIHPGKEKADHYDRLIFSDPGLRIILLTILSRGTLEMLESFEARFLDQSCESSDKDLPFEMHYCLQLFGSRDGRKFFENQFPFLAPTLAEGTFRREYQSFRCLPYLEQKLLGRGSFGTVYKVKIERGHFEFREPKSRNLDPVWLARKDFDPNEESYEAFKAEDLILKAFMNSSNCPSSIMTSLGSVVHSFDSANSPSSSIFFPPASCNLFEYVHSPSNYPRTHTSRLQHVKQMLDISKGLEWLGNNLVYVPIDDRYTYATYYHCDLKPDNILVCENPYSGGAGSVTFKIADFGQARNLQQKPQDGKSRQQGSGPAIAINGREATYLAPETQDMNPSPEVRARSDVWSFGCILLMIFIFNYENVRGIKDFQEGRIRSSPNRQGDYFYNSEARHGANICNAAVTARLNHMIDKTKEEREEIDSKVAYESLVYLRKRILVQYKKRHGINEVSQTLHRIYNDRPPLKGREIRLNDVPKRASHCSHSPSGLVFFYAAEKISIYHSDPNPVRVIIPSFHESKWSETVRPRSKSCAFDTLCVVSEQSKVRPVFKCTIHTIGGIPTEPQLGNQKQHIELKTVRTPVDKVAMSPDGLLLAIACRPREDNTACARVRMYRLSDLRDDIPSTTDTASTNSDMSATYASSSTEMNNQDILQSMPELRSVKDNVDLCFSRDSKILYHVVRLKIDHQNTTPRVKVVLRRTLDGVQVSQCIIRDDDTTFEGVFLKSIVPLNAQVGFMAVTHERFIVRRTLHGSYLHGENIRIAGISRLKTLLITSDDERVVMLATPGNSDLQIFGATIGSLEAPRKQEISDRIRYNPDKDSAFLQENNGRIQLLVTTVRDEKTYTFDLQRLFSFPRE
ncbi:hypothetical protein F5Y15DRAFT_9520 [Xylariaceae sp. FL0016]|nr:hypothetical protein F5Y15DRAFT_9520 [Xylariaceae sp. FL0016]